MQNVENSYKMSDVESKRFDKNILRAVSENVELKQLQHHILTNNVDIVFLRIPSENTSQIQNLSKLGYEYFQTDSLVYYSVDFKKYEIKPLQNKDLQFIKASVNDKSVLAAMVQEIFNGYTNHYFSNQYLDKKGILDGYTEWVTDFIDGENKEVFLVYKDNAAVAFATCSLEDGIAEGVLYGVMPNSSGGGVYSDVIRYTQDYYFQKGVTNMKVSTQVQNYAVQKVWSREGFYMTSSFATIHINSLLSYSCLPIKEVSLIVTEEQINNYADISKDFNVIHFDDGEAKKCGFEGRIAHGLLACGEISRILGTDFPGTGTIFMNYKNIFLAPLYPNRKYKFILLTPYYNNKSIYICVVKVLDSEGKLVTLSYNHLIKK